MDDYFYRMRIVFPQENSRFANFDYDVYYRSSMELSPENVPKYAVRDGDLLALDMLYVGNVERISPNEYFKYMFE